MGSNHNTHSMLKVLIVDDEPLVREGLKWIVDWEAYGFTIVDEGCDGQDGLTKILAVQPDLVLADIKMPLLSGLEMLEAARKGGYAGEAIILTGYSDFNYAKTAIHIGVKSYLLKPIEETELIKVLEEVKVSCDEKNKKRSILDESEKILKENIIKMAVFDPVALQKVRVAIQADFPMWKQSQHTVVLLEIVNSEQVPERFNKLRQFLNRYFERQQSTNILPVEHKGCILFSGKSRNAIEVILKDLQIHLRSEEGLGVFIAVGRTCNSFEAVYQSYLDAKEIVERSFLYRDVPIFFFEEKAKENQNSNQRIQYMDTDYVVGMIEVGNEEAIDVYVERLEHSLLRSQIATDKIKGICVNYMIGVKEKLTAIYTECKDVFQSDEVLIDAIYDQATLHEVMYHMAKMFKVASNQICDNSTENTLKRILNYINNNYHKDLKLELLGKLFNYNSAYLGKVFKQKTGCNFNTYLDQIRIQRAKILLEANDYKIYEISEMVGYKSTDYFYSKFKKILNVSPKDYRQEYLERQTKVE